MPALHRSVTLGLTLSVGIACLSSTAFAGGKARGEVYIHKNGTTTSVDGSMGAARNSTDANQSIGCSMHASAIWCSAMDRNGVQAYCVAPAAQYDAFAKLVATINGDSSISFSYDNSEGLCKYFTVRNHSVYAPKAL